MSLIEAEDLGARPTASDVIARYLREAIMSGKVKEGLPIRQDEIAGLFNVSKIPVREALKRLEAEGLWRFHSCLYEDANRPFMVSLIRSVNDRLERFLRIQLSLSAGQAVADREHREILAACTAGDAELASRLVNRHIMDACSSLLLHLGKSR